MQGVSEQIDLPEANPNQLAGRQECKLQCPSLSYGGAQSILPE